MWYYEIYWTNAQDQPFISTSTKCWWTEKEVRDYLQLNWKKAIAELRAYGMENMTCVEFVFFPDTNDKLQ